MHLPTMVTPRGVMGPTADAASAAGAGTPTSVRPCAGCGAPISDRFLLFALEAFWHTRCLCCMCCHVPLADLGPSCYTRQGMVLCRRDYISMFGPGGACTACSLPIPSSELVMRTQGSVFHLKCFTCTVCQTRLVPGDRFQYISGRLFCEQDGPGKLTTTSRDSLALPSTPHIRDQKVC
uniref:Si:dkey-90l8.3 n=1 Tax=Eptatretus burgeri TaxID=7764 RepID=A0A8C4N4H4_EPTBU